MWKGASQPQAWYSGKDIEKYVTNAQELCSICSTVQLIGELLQILESMEVDAEENLI